MNKDEKVTQVTEQIGCQEKYKDVRNVIATCTIVETVKYNVTF